jgi:hypothetical protein
LGISADGESVKLYRGLINVDKGMAEETGHLSNFARSGAELANVDAKSIHELCSYASQFCQGNSPVLHTSRDKKFCESYVGSNHGVVITYEIPKRYFLTLSKFGYMFCGNQSEKEVDIFYTLNH